MILTVFLRFVKILQRFMLDVRYMRFLVLMICSGLFAENLNDDISKISSKSNEINANEKKAFLYGGIAANGFIVPTNPEVSIGIRKLNSHHVYDVNLSSFILLMNTDRIKFPTGIVGQLNYLFYPQVSEGRYFGIGVTGGFSQFSHSIFHQSFYFNIPITIGYQFKEPQKHTFIQVQMTPLVTTTVTYGVEF